MPEEGEAQGTGDGILNFSRLKSTHAIRIPSSRQTPFL